MRKNFILIMVLVLISFGLAFSEEVKTIKGEVVDLSCYIAEGEKGDTHKDCAIACIKAGEPAGILEEKTGKVYLVVTDDHSNPAPKVLPYVAKIVEVTGTVSERGGVTAIAIKDIK